MVRGTIFIQLDEKRSLSLDEKIDLLEKYKYDGNKSFDKKDYTDAQHCY